MFDINKSYYVKRKYAVKLLLRKQRQVLLLDCLNIFIPKEVFCVYRFEQQGNLSEEHHCTITPTPPILHPSPTITPQNLLLFNRNNNNLIIIFIISFNNPLSTNIEIWKKKYQRKEHEIKQKGLFCGVTVQTPHLICFVTLPTLSYSYWQYFGFSGVVPSSSFLIKCLAASKCFQLMV